MDKIKENNNDNTNTSKNKDFNIKNAESMDIKNLKNSFIEFQYDKVVNNILGLFKKLSKQRLVSTSSAIRDDMDKQVLNSRLFSDLYEDREILLNKILKKINILNLVYFRFLKETDIDDILNLHRELFPVKYHADFYFSICNFDDNKIVDDDVIKITEKIAKAFGTTSDNKKYAKYCDTYREKNDSILKNKVSTNDDDDIDDYTESDNEKELRENKSNSHKDTGTIKNYSNINSNEKTIIHKKWREDEIFSIGAFLPYSFIDYINNDSITDLVKNKTLEKLTEKEILLDYIQFLEKCNTPYENGDISIKSSKKKTNSFNDSDLDKSNDDNDINDATPTSQKINDNCKKGNNNIKNNHTFLNSHNEPNRKENGANSSMLNEEYSNTKKEPNKCLQNNTIKITNNSSIQDIYNHLGKKNLRYEEINGISDNRNDDVKLTNGKKYYDKETLNSFNCNMNNISYKKARKNYLIGSISCLINYGDFNDDKDYINIYNHFTQNYINNKNEKSYINNMCEASKNFLENGISLEKNKLNGMDKYMNMINKNNDNDIGDELNEENIGYDDNDSSFSTNVNDLKNSDDNLFTIVGKKKSKKKKKKNNVLKDLTILKMKSVNKNPQFEKKLYEEIYMNKNINEITKKYLTGNINNIYILTVGISEYFRGLNLASYLIEYTIYYFYFIIYRIFLYNNKLYCYVDNDVFYNLSNNIAKDENYNEGILYDNPNDNLPSVIKIEEKKKKKKHDENNYHDQTYNSQICEESCKGYIHTSSKKEKFENNEQNLSGQLINEEKREDVNIRTEEYTPCNGKDPLPDDNNFGSVCNGAYPKNYSLCNNIIRNLYKRIVLNDYLHDLYNIIHDKNFKNMKYKENENIPFTTNFCKQPLKEDNIIACSNITDEVFDIFFNELPAYNLKKNKKILIKRYNTTNIHDDGENKSMPLYIYLHVIDYNEAAINLYNKLKFDYIDKYDNFYVINKINFSSYLYSYFF